MHIYVGGLYPSDDDDNDDYGDDDNDDDDDHHHDHNHDHDVDHHDHYHHQTSFLHPCLLFESYFTAYWSIFNHYFVIIYLA